MSQEIQTPFHAGERAAQRRAGVGNVADWAGGFVRDFLPEQHRAFHTSLPFLVFAGADAEGRVWATIVEGADGFVRSPDPRHLVLNTALDDSDPLAERFSAGGDIGGLGIELGTRRRNRFSGRIEPGGRGHRIAMRQTFGNCPQYIHPRVWHRENRGDVPVARWSSALTGPQMARITQADTLFIGSGVQGGGAASDGYDAAHRGGAPGFVHVASPTRLLIPDYAGNNFFNTIGNLTSDPRIGLVFVDFETGGLLHLSGRASIDWAPRDAHDPDAWRMIEVEIDAVLDRPGALSLRWHRPDGRTRSLRLVRRVREAEGISSFCFAPADGHPLAPFQPGQHLPLAVRIPGQTGLTERSYSLSGPAHDLSRYRLTIKREAHGRVSRYLHDNLQVGDVIDAQPPAGGFVLPEGDGPVVLVSAGVGLTPMVSMLHGLAGTGRPVRFVHGTKNGETHALRSEVQGVVSRHRSLQRLVFYSRPGVSDRIGHDFDHEGRITAQALIAQDAGQAAYLLCGPAPFLADMRSGLEALGVPRDRIHFETFGPAAPMAGG